MPTRKRRKKTTVADVIRMLAQYDFDTEVQINNINWDRRPVTLMLDATTGKRAKVVFYPNERIDPRLP